MPPDHFLPDRYLWPDFCGPPPKFWLTPLPPALFRLTVFCPNAKFLEKLNIIKNLRLTHVCVCAFNNNDMVAWSSQLLINEMGQRRKFQSMAISFESNIVGVRVHHRKPFFVTVVMVVQQTAHSFHIVRCIYQGGLSSTTSHISLILMNTHHAQNIGKVLTSMCRTNAKNVDVCWFSGPERNPCCFPPYVPMVPPWKVSGPRWIHPCPWKGTVSWLGDRIGTGPKKATAASCRAAETHLRAPPFAFSPWRTEHVN